MDSSATSSSESSEPTSATGFCPDSDPARLRLGCRDHDATIGALLLLFVLRLVRGGGWGAVDEADGEAAG